MLYRYFTFLPMVFSLTLLASASDQDPAALSVADHAIVGTQEEAQAKEIPLQEALTILNLPVSQPTINFYGTLATVNKTISDVNQLTSDLSQQRRDTISPLYTYVSTPLLSLSDGQQTHLAYGALNTETGQTLLFFNLNY